MGDIFQFDSQRPTDPAISENKRDHERSLHSDTLLAYTGGGMGHHGGECTGYPEETGIFPDHQHQLELLKTGSDKYSHYHHELPSPGSISKHPKPPRITANSRYYGGCCSR